MLRLKRFVSASIEPILSLYRDFVALADSCRLLFLIVPVRRGEAAGPNRFLPRSGRIQINVTLLLYEQVLIPCFRYTDERRKGYTSFQILSSGKMENDCWRKKAVMLKYHT